MYSLVIKMAQNSLQECYNQLQRYNQQQLVVVGECSSDDDVELEILCCTVVQLYFQMKKRTTLLAHIFGTELDSHSSVGRPRRYLKFSTYWSDLKAMPDLQFLKRMRVSPGTFRLILEDIRHLIELPASGNLPQPIPAKIRFAICLKFLVTGDSLVTISTLFAVGVSTTYQIIKDVVEALVLVYNKPSHFPFPESESDCKRIAQGFFFKSQFPLIIGALDGTHIPIHKPKDDPASYRNYKNFESLHVMCMCDHKTKILYHNVGMPGKNDDSYVFKQSDLPEKLRSLPTQFHAIADPAYPLTLQLMKRYPGDALPMNEEHYNYRQSRARMIVESLYGRIKGRFRCLLKSIGFHDLHFVCNIIVACLCLHNILVDNNDDNFPGMCDDEEYHRLMQSYHITSRDAPYLRGPGGAKAKKKRDMLRNLVNGELSEEQCIAILNTM